MTSGPTQPESDQSLIAREFAVMAGHQPKATESAVQTFQRIAGVEHLKGVLKRIATPPIHGGVNLDVPSGEHQEGGTELINRDAQNPMHIKHRQCSEIKNALRNVGETLVQVIGEVDRPDRKDGITGQSDQQNPFIGKLWLSRKLVLLQEILHEADANNRVSALA